MDRLQHADDALAWRGDMPTEGRYTAGVAGERFFRAIQEEGRFLATVCLDCDITYMPPRLYCEACFAHLDEWIEVAATGHVHTFTVVHHDLDEEPLPEPQIMAFVTLDETDGGLVHYLGEVEPEEVYLGMPVEPVLKDQEDREGGIRDIEYFRPIMGAS
jgi:hypothetical protein